MGLINKEALKDMQIEWTDALTGKKLSNGTCRDCNSVIPANVAHRKNYIDGVADGTKTCMGCVIK